MAKGPTDSHFLPTIVYDLPMAPILPYLASLLHTFNQPDVWATAASDVSERVRAASEGVDASCESACWRVNKASTSVRN